MESLGNDTTISYSTIHYGEPHGEQQGTIEKTGDMITLRIVGNGFLYNMVRIIVGTLVKIGCGLWPLEKMQEALDACDRSAAGPTAPAKGLTLISIVEQEDGAAEEDDGEQDY